MHGRWEATGWVSENRAKSVKDWLVGNGQIPPVCMKTAGYGATQPVAPNTTPDGRQKNRRVEVKIEKTGKGDESSGGTD